MTYDKLRAALIEAAEEAHVFGPDHDRRPIFELAVAIHEYGGMCRSRYGKRTCSGADHRLMAEAIVREYAALQEQPE